MNATKRIIGTIKQVRIWDAESEKFYFSGRTPMMQSSFWKDTATLHTVDGQQYEYETGAKDVDGAEIYEGDICIARWKEDDEEWSEEFEVVRQGDGSYWIDVIDNGDYCPSIGAPDVEVKRIRSIHDKAATNEN